MKAKNIIQTVLIVGMGIMFAMSGANKFFHFSGDPKLTAEAGALMGAFANSGWMLPLIGFIEILGPVLMVIPKTRALGAIVLLPVTIGILLFHIALEPAGIIPGVVFTLINAWVIFDNREKYMPMIS